MHAAPPARQALLHASLYAGIATVNASNGFTGLVRNSWRFNVDGIPLTSINVAETGKPFLLYGAGRHPLFVAAILVVDNAQRRNNSLLCTALVNMINNSHKRLNAVFHRAADQS